MAFGIRSPMNVDTPLNKETKLKVNSTMNCLNDKTTIVENVWNEKAWGESPLEQLVYF